MFRLFSLLVLEFSTIVPSAAIVDKSNDSDDSSDDSEVEVTMSTSGTLNGLDTVERLCAKTFVERLAAFVPVLLTASDVQKADQIIQEFSSKFCAGSFLVISLFPNIKFLIILVFDILSYLCVHSISLFIHSFILGTYIALLLEATSQRRSQPSHGQRRRT